MTHPFSLRVVIDCSAPHDLAAIDLDPIRGRLLERGATEVGRGSEGPHEWVTYADPEGNEFCL